MYKQILVFFIAILVYSCNFAPGSYPFAEKYELNYSEEEVKIAVKKLKRNNTEFMVPHVTINNKRAQDLVDGPVGPHSHWYKFYIYYKKENQIIYTWVQSIDKNRSRFAFVTVMDGLDLANKSYDINNDFSSTENKEQLKKFEERILSKVKYYLENPDKGNGAE